MPAFEKGNQLAAKGRKVERMIERALVQEDDRRLREGVEKVLDLFSQGDRWAVEFVTDRIDGKAAQTQRIIGDPEHPLTVQHSGRISAEAESLIREITGGGSVGNPAAPSED